MVEQQLSLPPPTVRLQVRVGSVPPAEYEVNDESFLIGTVPGCDLRLPGARLPPVLALISRGPAGVLVRRLVPVQPVLLNSQPIAAASLADGDVITIGSTDLVVKVVRVPVPPPKPTPHPLEGEISRREIAIAQKEQEQAAVRQELADLRQQIDEHYRARRDRLVSLHASVRRAARKIRERKLQLETEAQRTEFEKAQDSGRAAELTRAVEIITQEKQKLEEQRLLVKTWHEEMEADLSQRVQEVQHQEREAADRLKAAERAQAQLQTELLHLNRREAALESKQQQLNATARDVDRKFEQLQRDSRDLEEQAAELDAWHRRLTEEQQNFDGQRAELTRMANEIHQRAATLDGQQSMLTTLRGRLERMREEALAAEKEMTDQRQRFETLETQLAQRQRDLLQREREFEAERSLLEQDRRGGDERQKVLEAAVFQMRQAQEALEAEEARLLAQKEEINRAAAEQAEATALAQARTTQATELQKRLDLDREALAARDVALTQAEQTLTALQEQLRRRSDDLATRQRDLQERARLLDEEVAGREKALGEIAAAERGLEDKRRQIEEALALKASALEQRVAEHQARVEELSQREETIRRHVEQLKEAGLRLDGERQRLADAQLVQMAERQAAEEGLALARRDLEALEQTTLALQKQLPLLEDRAREAAQRLEQAREHWREHLAEEHAFAVQSREDLDRLHAQAQAEAERLRMLEAELHRARADHRLAVAAFRQQLIEWQGQVGEMRLALAQNSTRLERRQAEVEEQARQVQTAGARLAEKAEILEQQEREVAEKHDEIHRHLDDMREWYRRKLRELVGVDDESDEVTEESGIGSSPPVDRQLGDLLRSLELVDDATLAALLAEARRQRRSLRQLLLSGGYLTLYQMALIEAGNVAALALGPVRVVDRLRATPHEAAYLVYDPRHDRKAVLRHLSEADAADAVRPDEFRQRFAAAAAIQHPNLAATLEVLEITNRPAILQEWLQGLPATDWPAYTNVPGVWYRLMSQAALALQTAHQAGLVHGSLSLASLVLTTEGTLKLTGVGEPTWLVETEETEDGPSSHAGDGTAASDLAALGQIAQSWANATPEGGRKGSKPKPLPASLQRIVQRLTSDLPEEAYPSVADLLSDLERAGEDVPANATAWERLVRAIREQVGESNLRLSA